jgi:hypothetical protein
MFKLPNFLNRPGVNSVNSNIGAGQLAAMRAQAAPREAASAVSAIAHGDVTTALQEGIAAKTNAAATVNHVEQKVSTSQQNNPINTNQNL